MFKTFFWELEMFDALSDLMNLRCCRRCLMKLNKLFTRDERGEQSSEVIYHLRCAM